MRVLIVHDEIPASARPDERDALVQADAIGEALNRLGHVVEITALTLNLQAAAERIRAHRPDCIFNLVESVGGQGRLIHLGPALFDTLNIPCTGADVASMVLTTSKVLARRILHPLPMPRHFTLDELSHDAAFVPGRYIVKSVWEEASLGLDDDSVVEARTTAELAAAIQSRAPALGGEAFAEEYIDGREFNLSLLASGRGRSADVLPPAEIQFVGFAPHRPRIVGYAAKWHEDSLDYGNTPRTFDFPDSDRSLVARLCSMAQACWSAAGLCGYARVDFRVNASGEPYILEINANPCLSPDAGFAAAAREAGLPFEEVVRRILDDAMHR